MIDVLARADVAAWTNVEMLEAVETQTRREYPLYQTDVENYVSPLGV
jgi:hypothetical protein